MKAHSETSLFVELNQDEASTVQGGHYGWYCRRYRVAPVYYVQPCSTPSYVPVSSGVTQNVNINIDD